MTSHQLARKLLELPDLMVTVRGYEGGMNEVVEVIGPSELLLNIHDDDSWRGRHDYHGPEDWNYKTMAIHINGE